MPKGGAKKLDSPEAPTTEGCGQVFASEPGPSEEPRKDLAVDDNLKEAKRTSYRGFFGQLSEDKVPLFNIVLAGRPVQILIDLGASDCIINLEICRIMPASRSTQRDL